MGQRKKQVSTGTMKYRQIAFRCEHAFVRDYKDGFAAYRCIVCGLLTY